MLPIRAGEIYVNNTAKRSGFRKFNSSCQSFEINEESVFKLRCKNKSSARTLDIARQEGKERGKKPRQGRRRGNRNRGRRSGGRFLGSRGTAPSVSRLESYLFLMLRSRELLDGIASRSDRLAAYLLPTRTETQTCPYCCWRYIMM